MLYYILFTIGIVHLLCELDGPNNIIKDIRERIPENINPLLCHYCTSFWVGLFLSFLEHNPLLIGVAIGTIVLYEKIKFYIDLHFGI